MKTPEEIKRGLECCAIRKNCAECPYKDGKLSEDCMNTLEAEALAYIRQLEMLAKPNEQIRWERDVAVDQLRQLGIGFGEKVEAQVPKWISVEDHTPMNEDDVLILINGKNINIGWFNEQGGVWHVSSNCILVEVTHWMPLPEPPKEG